MYEYVLICTTDMYGKSPHYWERRVKSSGGVDPWSYADVYNF